ncbi:MAG TPA: asparagine synthase (glutamine-hydrolyzing) [Chitinophagaceae bacterium]|jgi:asparagine synthase (glutamine-hydrolysing)|nr:asparagine synthase (glutamine-hydrolyzing) [Chitinophagaceae bacterium]
MCGIAGIISSNSQLVSSQRLQQMTHALAHRGPDGEGIWINDNATVGFGHRRLSIIDLSDAAAQPFPFLNRYHIIHNGEIYNYTELRAELQKAGYSFLSQSDTEVIPAAYDHWKEECVDHFDGMFAFAIWDEKEKNLFAARDRFGEKPFFYYADKEQFIFASEMKALWAAGIQRRVNLKMLFNFITIGYVDNPGQPDETFFEQIKKLPAACILKYDPEFHKTEIEKYWDIDPQDLHKKITDQEAIERFSELFSDSVKKRVRSDVPVGTSLSGGLDSSSVVAFSQRENSVTNSHKCFTAIFPGFEKDEFVFSNKVAKQYHLQHFTVAVQGEELVQDLEKLFYYQEEPIVSASIFAQYKVFELAKNNNVTVLLDGQGADEVLAGYHKYYKWYWQELFHKRKLLRSGELKAAKKNNVEEKFGVKNIFASLFPDLASVFLERQYLVHALTQEDLDKDFVRFQSKEAYYATPGIMDLNGVLYFNTCTHGLQELLRFADRNSMAHGREVRLPFLNHQLVEFVFSLSSNFKIRNGWTKWLLRKTMEKELPAEINWRKEKVGFEPPQKKWMEQPAVQEIIINAKKKMVDENILKPEVLNKKIQYSSSVDPDNFDWRYLAASMCF